MLFCCAALLCGLRRCAALSFSLQLTIYAAVQYAAVQCVTGNKFAHCNQRAWHTHFLITVQGYVTRTLRNMHPTCWWPCELGRTVSQSHCVLQVVDWMLRSGVKPNVRTYTALVTSMGNARQWHKALELIQQMKAAAVNGSGVEPNAYTYSALLKTMGDQVGCSGSADYPLFVNQLHEVVPIMLTARVRTDSMLGHVPGCTQY